MKKNFVSTYQGTAAAAYNTPHHERNIMAAWLFFLHYMQYIRLLSHEASRIALYDRCLEHAQHPEFSAGEADVATRPNSK